MFACSDPDENEENPHLRVINSFQNYKITNVIVNVQSFLGSGVYLMPGKKTDYKNVNPGKSLLISYHWQHVSDTGDHGDFGRITAVGDYPELVLNEKYTLTYSGDKTEPTVIVTQP